MSVIPRPSIRKAVERILERGVSTISTDEGFTKNVPDDDNAITNKSYVDENAGEDWDTITNQAFELPDADKIIIKVTELAATSITSDVGIQFRSTGGDWIDGNEDYAYTRTSQRSDGDNYDTDDTDADQIVIVNRPPDQDATKHVSLTIEITNPRANAVTTVSWYGSLGYTVGERVVRTNGGGVESVGTGVDNLRWLDDGVAEGLDTFKAQMTVIQ